MKFRVLSAIAIAAAVVAGPARSEDATQAQALDVGYSVYLHALGFADGIMTDEQEVTMELIAYQAAVARVCPDIEIDPQRMGAAAQSLDHVNTDDLSPEEEAYADRLAMMVLGMSIGGFLAEFAINPDAFCDGSAEFITEDFGDRMITKQ